MKTSLFKALILAIISLPALAQDYTSAVLATDTPVALLTTRAIVTQVTLTATTANATRFKFYDMSTTTSTNVVYAATVSYTTFPTNIVQVHTNEAGIILTNTFSGNFTLATAVGAVTNERPRILTITVPASSQRVLTLTKRLNFGLVAQANAAGLVEVEYE